MTTTIVLDPKQFLQLSPLQIKEIVSEITSKETAAEPSNESKPANEVSNKNESQQVKEQTNHVNIEKAPENEPIVINNSPTDKKPIILNTIEKRQVIDVEGNNARASFHLSIFIAIMLTLCCMVPLTFVPFTIVYFRFRSNPTESPKVHAFTEKSRWIAIGILFSNLVMIFVASMIVLIVLFSIGIFRR